MTFDPKAFATQLGLAPDDQAALLALFEKYPTAGERVTSLVSSEVESQLTPLRADLDKKTRELDDQFSLLENVRGADSQTLDAAHKRTEAAVTAVSKAQERIRRLASTYGVDPSEWLKDLETDMPSTTSTGGNQPLPSGNGQAVQSPLDLTKVLQQSGLQAWTSFRSSVDMMDIQNEHQQLFGKPLMNAMTLVDKLQDKVKRTGNGNLTLRDIWHEEYKVPEKRLELQEADIKRRETDAYERGKREAADAAALGTTTVQTQPAGFAQSPVLAQLTKDTPTRVSGVPEGVVAAIADYRQRMINRKPA